MTTETLLQLGTGGLLCYVLLKEILGYITSIKKDSEAQLMTKRLENLESVISKMSVAVEKLTIITEIMMEQRNMERK